MNNTSTSITRDGYGAIVLRLLDRETTAAVQALVADAGAASKIDEHGSWKFGCEFDRKGRGYALNWDVYGIGADVHSGQLLAVIQIRQYVKAYKNGYGNVRKNYFLVGRNEDGTTFAHAVSHAPIHAAIRRGEDVVLAVQDWIFGGEYSGMIRQGDLALIPLKSRPAGSVGQTRRKALLEGSHELTATQIAEVDGRIYAKNPRLLHLPGVHPAVEGAGWYRIVIGRRAQFWSFAAPTID